MPIKKATSKKAIGVFKVSWKTVKNRGLLKSKQIFK